MSARPTRTGIPSRTSLRAEAPRTGTQFRVLGPIEVTNEGRPITLGGPKQRAVLAHLIIRANQVVPSDALIDLVWGEEPPDAVRTSLQSYVSNLRKALGSNRLEGRTPGYILHLEATELDASRFELLLREARTVGDQPDQATPLLRKALELWRGPAYADLATEEPLAGEIARLNDLRLQALEERVDADIASGRHVDVIGKLETLTREHPLRERLWGQLMLALYRSGRQTDALAAYQRLRNVLADELGVDPSPDLQRLYERILRQDPGLELVGEPLRGYRVLEQIGEGAFGVVYRATQPQIGREVAIKAVHPELANHPDFVRRFEREAQIVARLEHPHIVPLYDYWREPDAAYLVMRYLRGGSLADLIDAGPLEPARATDVLDQVASALAAAHRQGIVHRDVKPGNVLLDGEGNAYLTDFGVALDVGSPEQTTGTMMRGTPAYLSPEQIRLEPTTPRSDVYALGVVLYEMLTAEHPFPGTSLTVLLDQHLHRPIPSVRDKRPETPPAVDATIGRATAKDPEVRFPDVLEFAAAFRLAVEGSGRLVATAGEMRNPYKGLRAFLEADSADFFGREILTRRLVERMAETGAPRFLCAVGPSGSGKSSVVRAGLVPAIRRAVIPGSDRWYVIEVHPGAHPMRELETALLGVSVEPPPSLLEDLERDELGLARAVARLLPDPEAELLIVLDQLEEIFTMVEDEAERVHVLESIRAATADPVSRIRVIATLRADYYDQPLSVRGFGDLLAARTEAITPMSPEELERAIVGPAERVGLGVEPGLVAAMIADVVDRPGALPLLQYALTEIADREDVTSLTLNAYRLIGGVSGALARRAEHLYDALDDAGRPACRQLFLQLVTLGEGSEDTRRRVRRSELTAAEGSVADAVIDGFGRHRLLSFDRDPVSREPTVEIAHEALIGAWARLRRWIDEARDDLRTQRRLADAAAEWVASGRDASFLLRGARLEQTEEWAVSTTLAMSLEDRGYLGASVGERDREQADEASRLANDRAVERRSVRRLRALVAALSVGVLVTATLTVIALNRNASAERASRLATARELAGAASGLVESDSELATRLALLSIETTAQDDIVIPDAELSLRRAAPSLAVRSLGGFDEVSLTPDLSRVAIVGATGPTAVWDAAGGQPGRRVFTVPTETPDPSDCPGSSAWARWEASSPRGPLPTCDAVFEAALSSDGSLLATANGDATVRVWDVASGRTRTSIDLYANLRHGLYANLLPLPLSDFPSVLAPNVGFSADGRYLWTDGAFGGWRLWDLATGKQVLEAPPELGIGEPQWPPGKVSFSGDGRWLALGGLRVQIWDLVSRELLVEVPFFSFYLPAPSFAPDGTAVAIGIGDSLHLVNLVDPSDSQDLLGFLGSGNQSSAEATDLEFSPDGTHIAATSLTGIARVWDVETGRYITLTTALRPATALAWSPDGRRLAVGGGQDGAVQVWEIGSGRMVATIPTASSVVVDLAFTPDGRQIAVATDDGTVSLNVVNLGDLIDLARDRVSRGFTDEECRQYLHVPNCPSD